MVLYDIEWTHTDNPDENQRVSIVKKDIRNYIETRCPLAKLIRQLSPGDSVKLVDGNKLRTITVRCYETDKNRN